MHRHTNWYTENSMSLCPTCISSSWRFKDNILLYLYAIKSFLWLEWFWQAWHTLSSLKISCRNYIRPGVSIPVENAGSDTSRNFCRRATLQSSSGHSKFSEPMHNHQNHSQTSVKASEPVRCTGSFLPSHDVRAMEAGNGLVGSNESKASVVNNSDIKFSDGSFSNHSLHASQKNESAEVLADDIDDDEILKVTHVVGYRSN